MMKTIDEFIYISSLYAIYKELLTDKQKDILDKYYNFNLSLKEISDDLNISRTAVSDALNHAKNNLLDYENKLKFYEKDIKIRDILVNTKDVDKLKKEIEEVLNNGI